MLTNSKTVVDWVAARVGSIPNPNDSVAIGQVSGDHIVAGAYYDRYTGRSITITVAVEKGTHVAKDFLRAIFQYPFNQLGVERLVAYSSTDNKASLDLIRRVGFKLQAVIPNIYPEGDMVISAMTKEQAKYLEH